MQRRVMDPPIDPNRIGCETAVETKTSRSVSTTLRHACPSATKPVRRRLAIGPVLACRSCVLVTMSVEWNESNVLGCHERSRGLGDPYVMPFGNQET